MPTKNYRQYYRKYYEDYLQPIVNSRKTTAYFMIILSCLTISFFGLFAIRPTLMTIAELKKQIQDSQLVNDKLQQKINALITAQEEMQRIRPFIPAVYEAVPNNPSITSLMSKLESLAEESEVTLASYELGSITYNFQKQSGDDAIEEKQNLPPVSIDITVYIRGKYSQVKSYLDKLLTSRRIISAKSAQLSGEGADITVLKLNLKLDSYYVK